MTDPRRCTFLFNLADLPAAVGPRDQKYGLLDIEGNPKPVYGALQNFFAVTGDRLEPRDPPKVEAGPKDLYSIAWTRSDGKQLWMFWSAGGRQLTLSGVSGATLHDPLSGSHRELKADGESLKVPLKRSLQLLVW
jgi:beta-xylosidase